MQWPAAHSLWPRTVQSADPVQQKAKPAGAEPAKSAQIGRFRFLFGLASARANQTDSGQLARLEMAASTRPSRTVWLAQLAGSTGRLRATD